MAKKKVAAKNTKSTKSDTPTRRQIPMIPMQPRGDRVIIEAPAPKTTTDGGIILPQAALEKKSQIGKVVAVGPGRTENGVLVPLELKVGDKVMVGLYAGMPVEENTELGIPADTYTIMREDDIVATIGYSS